VARQRTIIALDPGTTKTCALAVRIGEGAPHVIGAARAASAGIRKGVVADLKSASASMAEATARALRAAAARCDRVWVSVSGSHIDALPARAEVTPAGAEVRQRDLDTCLSRAVERAPMPVGREVLHVLPGEFSVDGHGGIASPLGMAAQRLRVQALLVTASVTGLDNLERCLESVGLVMEHEVVAGLAAAWATTDDAEREAGALVIDIGGGTTDFMAFRKGSPALVGCFDIAGAHVTRDVAMGLRVGLGEAERLKREHAAALARLVPASEIPVSSGGRVGRWFLAEIVEARMREILEMVRERMDAAGLTPGLVVLTGGETRLAGTAELAQQVFACPARVGWPAGPQAVGVARDPAWAVVLGVAYFAGEQRAMATGPPRGAAGRALHWLRDWFK
jgi:cell division protein FtsA